MMRIVLQMGCPYLKTATPNEKKKKNNLRRHAHILSTSCKLINRVILLHEQPVVATIALTTNVTANL